MISQRQAFMPTFLIETVRMINKCLFSNLGAPDVM